MADRWQRRFRVVTLNLEQDHKRWDERSRLVVEGMKISSLTS